MLTIKKKNLTNSITKGTRWSHALRVEWLGQMMASLLWVASVFTYGISSAGDVLQLCAALTWTLANIDALMRARPPEGIQTAH